MLTPFRLSKFYLFQYSTFPNSKVFYMLHLKTCLRGDSVCIVTSWYEAFEERISNMLRIEHSFPCSIASYFDLLRIVCSFSGSIATISFTSSYLNPHFYSPSISTLSSNKKRHPCHLSFDQATSFIKFLYFYLYLCTFMNRLFLILPFKRTFI